MTTNRKSSVTDSASKHKRSRDVLSGIKNMAITAIFLYFFTLRLFPPKKEEQLSRSNFGWVSVGFLTKAIRKKNFKTTKLKLLSPSIFQDGRYLVEVDITCQ